MNLTVNTDARTLASAFHRAPAKVTRHINVWIQKTAFRVEREAKKQVPPNVDKGQLQSSIHTTIGHLKAVVRPTAKHAIWVHKGRMPGSMPPWGEGTQLNDWARRKGIPAFLVAKSIQRKGTKANKFMDKAYKIVKPTADREAHKTLVEIVRSI